MGKRVIGAINLYLESVPRTGWQDNLRCFAGAYTKYRVVISDPKKY